jgi:hypothetical protein
MEKRHVPKHLKHASTVSSRQASSLAVTIPGLLGSSTVLASFNGPLDIGFWPAFGSAAVLAFPGALLCVMAEVIGTRHRPPLWIGLPALALSICCLLLALRIIGPGGDSGLFIFPIPPLMTLALVSLLPAPGWRLVAVWAVALGVFALLAFSFGQAGSSSSREDSLGLLMGGASGSMLPWQLAFIFQQRSRRRASHAPPPAPSFKPLFQSLVAATSSGHPGLMWWLGSATVFYLSVMGLSALGMNQLLMATLAIEWRISDFLGLAWLAPQSASLAAWAGPGLLWAALIGAGVWGVAASTGRFDPGRLASYRLAVILLAAVMIGWMAAVILSMRQ